MKQRKLYINVIKVLKEGYKALTLKQERGFSF